MSILHGDEEELTASDASIVKGMLARGDKNETVAAYFGVNQRAISHIRSAKTFDWSAAAPAGDLPPPGPYGVDPIYVRFYRTMTKVNQLWEERQLGRAKALLEKALKSPVYATELEAVDEAFAEIARDQFGLAQL
jgi:hypothetical protein